MSQKQTTGFSCSKCGKIFSKPIELTVLAKSSHETYCACPHCFSRVNLENRKVEGIETSSDKLKKGPSEAPPSVPKKGLKRGAKGNEKIKPAGCAHFLGYLKTRPEDSTIPDECLTCTAVMQCMGLSANLKIAPPIK